MNLTIKDVTNGGLLLLLTLFSSIALAQSSPAATITQLKGFVTAESAEGTQRTLKNGDTLSAGDTIRTTKRSSARLRFSDRSLISLRPKTTFEITKYSFDETSSDNTDIELLIRDGALEAISGLVGKLFPSNFRMNTPISTIGIRGTAYQVEVIRPTTGPIEIRVATLEGAIVYSSISSSGKNNPLPTFADPKADISSLQVEINDNTNEVESVVLEAGQSLSQSESTRIAIAIGRLFSPNNDNDYGNDNDDDGNDSDDDTDTEDVDDTPAPGSAID